MLKTLSSAGMLLFLAALLGAFLCKMGFMKNESLFSMGKTAAACIFTAFLYEMTAQLLYCIIYGEQSFQEIRVLFWTKEVQSAFDNLETGSGIWNLPGHLIGKICFGEYFMGGLLFSFLLTFSASHLIFARMKKLYGAPFARWGQALVLFLPGMGFCFLPGWGAWAFFAAALIFYKAGAFLRSKEKKNPGWKEECALLFAGLLSAMVLYVTVTGRLN